LRLTKKIDQFLSTKLSDYYFVIGIFDTSKIAEWTPGFSAPFYLFIYFYFFVFFCRNSGYQVMEMVF